MTIPFFDTKECEWADTKVLIAGGFTAKIRGAKYGAAQEKELLFGAGRKALSIQSGNESNQGEIKVLKSVLDDMNRAAIAAGADNILGVEFDIVITYRKKGKRLLQTDTLVGCEIQAFEKGWDQGAKFMEITLAFLFLDLKST